MIALNDNIVAALLERVKLRPRNLEILRRDAKGNAITFAMSLIHGGVLDRDSAGEVLAGQVGCTYVNLGKVMIVNEIANILTADLAQKFRSIPMYRLGDAITVGMAEPWDSATIAALENCLKMPVSRMFCFPDEVDSAIRVHYQTIVNIDDLIAKLNVAALFGGENSEARLAELAKSKPIAEISDAIILLALKEQASDIHIEPKKNEALIRFRIDGSLENKMYLPVELAAPLASRYKIISGMDITERRKPQDGRLNFQLPDRSLDLRVSCLPVLYGEKLVLRLLGSIYTNSLLNLDKLDISNEILRPMKEVLKQPHGILFVTGPTGSGKSTTLYAALNYLSTPEINILTIEDPVEYDVPALNQVMVNEKIGRTFQAALRSALRQDPDVILIGEIRDTETARIATQAALTGHMLLTSLHTNDAIQATTRLIEMGVEPFLVAPALLGIINQRLIRRICQHCKVSYRPSPEELQQYFYWKDGFDLPELFRGDGCEKCNGRGYAGRVAIHEFLHITPAIRDAILRRAGYTEIRKIADQEGFQDIRYDGFKKMVRGLVTLEEVVKATITEIF